MGRVSVYFEAAAVIVSLTLLGQILELAQVTLVKGDLRGIAQARAISNETIANMKHDLAWLLSPMIAALAMSLSSVSVISNALRLRGRKP